MFVPVNACCRVARHRRWSTSAWCCAFSNNPQEGLGGRRSSAYCFVASLLPVWLLLQPRGYLGGFVLYFALGVGRRSACFSAGLPVPRSEFAIRQPAFKSFDDHGRPFGRLFPFLFVTIACGACSGLPRARVQRHHVQADREGDRTLPPRRLRRECCSRPSSRLSRSRR
jgi:hypothetical protein